MKVDIQKLLAILNTLLGFIRKLLKSSEDDAEDAQSF